MLSAGVVEVAARIVPARMPADTMAFRDIWEPDPANRLPRPDIVTILTVRRMPAGIACHLRAEFNGDSCELPSAVATVGEVANWLSRYDTGKFATDHLGMQDRDALGLCNHWLEVFAGPLLEWNHQVVLPHRRRLAHLTRSPV